MITVVIGVNLRLNNAGYLLIVGKQGQVSAELTYAEQELVLVILHELTVSAFLQDFR